MYYCPVTVTFYDKSVVVEALALTLAVTFGLTVYTLQSKRDFSSWGAGWVWQNTQIGIHKTILYCYFIIFFFFSPEGWKSCWWSLIFAWFKYSFQLQLSSSKCSYIWEVFGEYTWIKHVNYLQDFVCNYTCLCHWLLCTRSCTAKLVFDVSFMKHLLVISSLFCFRLFAVLWILIFAGFFQVSLFYWLHLVVFLHASVWT